MSGKTYRVAILGMGGMGICHSGNLLKAPDVEIVAMCSPTGERARAYVEKWGLSTAIYSDGKRMIKDEKPDILYICLPPYAHDGQLELAASQGAHIFIEKPIAMTEERGRSMVEAVKAAGVYSQVGYHMRFGYAVQKLKELIDSGAAGRPTLYNANYECNSLHSPWWIDVDKCGGQVFEQVIHLYDMGLFLMGQPASVSGHISNLMHTQVPGYTVEDTSVSAIRFQSGALGSITGSNCAVPGRWNGMFKVICGNVVAIFQDANNAKFIYTAEDNREEEVSGNNPMLRLETEYFLDVVRGNKPEFAPISEGLTGLRMVSGVVTSAHSGGNAVDLG